MEQIIINIANEFTNTPGARKPEEGDFSGEEFLKSILTPKFNLALETGKKLIVILDGTAGYATSFLEASFGGLARSFGSKIVLNNIELVSEEEAYLKDEIIEYIKEAKKGS